jgi:hypothetical protein
MEAGAKAVEGGHDAQTSPRTGPPRAAASKRLLDDPKEDVQHSGGDLRIVIAVYALRGFSPSCPDGTRALLSSSLTRSAMRGDVWVDQFFRSAGVTFHAITVFSLFATRCGLSGLSWSLRALSV